MPSSVTLSAHGFRFCLTLDAYERPDADDRDDAMWVTGSVEVALGSFRAKQDVHANVDAVARFQRELMVLDRSLSGRAELTHLDGQFGVVVELINGRGTVTGFVADEFDAVARLSFDQVAIDQSFLAPTLAELARALVEFPVRAI